MSDIDMQFTTDEASALLRALAIARQRANGIDERDDLELLHGRIYDAVYRTQRHDSGAAVRESHRKRVVEIRPIPHLSPEHVITAA
jgi:cobalamin biosynthesis protein CbiG